MSTFDPWTATLEVAELQPDADRSPDGAIFQWAVAFDLTARREAIERGDGFDVLQAVAACAVQRLVMPDWLVRAFLRRYRAVQQLQVASWDAPEAFGPPYRKGSQLAAMRRRRDNRLRVAKAVREFVQAHPDQPLDPQWEAIGTAIGEGKSNAQDLYRQAVSMGFAMPPSEIRRRLGWPEVPAKLPKLAGRRTKR